MKKLAAAAALTAAALLASTCGTYRAYTGDFASDAPLLRSVSPNQTVSGQQVTFVADFCDVNGGDVNLDGVDDTPVEFFWDFGGGAEPNTTSLESPTVTVRDGIRAPYTCRITLTDGCLGKDNSQTYEFTLFVSPLSVLAVTPTTARAGQRANFSAVVGSGNVTSYAWDFGGACTPSGSNIASPNVTFSLTPSTYQARVIISNNFEAVEFPFTITVLPGDEE